MKLQNYNESIHLKARKVPIVFCFIYVGDLSSWSTRLFSPLRAKTTRGFNRARAWNWGVRHVDRWSDTFFSSFLKSLWPSSPRVFFSRSLWLWCRLSSRKKQAWESSYSQPWEHSFGFFSWLLCGNWCDGLHKSVFLSVWFRWTVEVRSPRASLVAQTVKNLPVMPETWVPSPSPGDLPEGKRGMATHSSILAWRIHMDRGVWWATVHGVAKSRTQLSD